MNYPDWRNLELSTAGNVLTAHNMSTEPNEKNLSWPFTFIASSQILKGKYVPLFDD